MMRELTTLHATMAAAHKGSGPRSKRGSRASQGGSVSPDIESVKQEEGMSPPLSAPKRRQRPSTSTGYDGGDIYGGVDLHSFRDPNHSFRAPHQSIRPSHSFQDGRSFRDGQSFREPDQSFLTSGESIGDGQSFRDDQFFRDGQSFRDGQFFRDGHSFRSDDQSFRPLINVDNKQSFRPSSSGQCFREQGEPIRDSSPGQSFRDPITSNKQLVRDGQSFRDCFRSPIDASTRRPPTATAHQPRALPPLSVLLSSAITPTKAPAQVPLPPIASFDRIVNVLPLLSRGQSGATTATERPGTAPAAFFFNRGSARSRTGGNGLDLPIPGRPAGGTIFELDGNVADGQPISPAGGTYESPFSYNPPAVAESTVTVIPRKRSLADAGLDTATVSRPNSRRLSVMELCNDTSGSDAVESARLSPVRDARPISAATTPPAKAATGTISPKPNHSLGGTTLTSAGSGAATAVQSGSSQAAGGADATSRILQQSRDIWRNGFPAAATAQSTAAAATVVLSAFRGPVPTFSVGARRGVSPGDGAGSLSRRGGEHTPSFVGMKA